MVLLHAKGETEENQFLFECPASSGVGEISAVLVEIHNIQSKILQLSFRLGERVFDGSSPDSWTPEAISLYRTMSEAASYVSKDQVDHNRPLSVQVSRNHLQHAEKEITSSKLLRSLGITSSQLLSGCDLLNENTTELRWAGKVLPRGKRLCNYIGNNEKTKIIVRLQPTASVQPHSQSPCK